MLFRNPAQEIAGQLGSYSGGSVLVTEITRRRLGGLRFDESSQTAVASFVVVQFALSSKIFAFGSVRAFASGRKFRTCEAARCRHDRVKPMRRGLTLVKQSLPSWT